MTVSVMLPAGRQSALARERFAATIATSDAFFARESVALAHACQDMALRFSRGGRLLVHADANRRSDVSHAVVEFMHPVVVGKRALAACAVTSATELAILGRPNDILMVMSDGGPERMQHDMLGHATAAGMLSIALMSAGARMPASHVFAVPSADACIVQETHEMVYHVLWELVHVFLDHGPAA